MDDPFRCAALHGILAHEVNQKKFSLSVSVSLSRPLCVREGVRAHVYAASCQFHQIHAQKN